LLSWFAWLSTLRPERMVALLSVVVLVAILHFCQTAAPVYLTVALLPATVAVTLHPAGVVALAPLLVAVPTLWRWARRRGRAGLFTLVALGLIAAAALVLLVLADTDLEKWRQSRDLFSTSELNTLSWRDELYRYKLLFDPTTLCSPVVRRGSVVFALVAVALFVTRPARRRDQGFDLPVMSLMVGAVLMAFTPSKWPLQLSALGGFAAIAVATELLRLGREPAGSESRNRRSLLVLGVTVIASAAWRGSADFGPFTVRAVHFGRGGSELLGVDLSSPVPWLVLTAGALVACTVAAWRRGHLSGRQALDRWLAVSGIWAVPVAVSVVAGATLGLFVTDAFAETPGWSLPRQNYDDLTSQTCGLGDDLCVADPATGVPLEPDRYRLRPPRPTPYPSPLTAPGSTSPRAGAPHPRPVSSSRPGGNLGSPATKTPACSSPRGSWWAARPRRSGSTSLA
jgi:Mycobacterial cell wall arabinan synthesis protein